MTQNEVGREEEPSDWDRNRAHFWKDMWMILTMDLGKAARPTMVCTRCGTVGKPERRVPGSGLAEFLLFLLFLIPGLIYRSYRKSATKDVCSACSADALVPVDSPAGRALIAKDD
jgi:hypothetical protein